MSRQDYMRHERENIKKQRSQRQQEQRHTDLELLVKAQTKAVNLLCTRDKYLGRHAQRVLRATKELERLAAELEE